MITRAINRYDITEKDKVASRIIDHFAAMTSPEVRITFDLVSIRQGGVAVGKSTKPGDIRLNWKFLLEASESILLIAGTSASPWFICLAALVIWNDVWAKMSIEISERHAMVIWTMWIHADQDNYIQQEKILSLVNNRLERYSRPQLDQEHLAHTLRELEELECIEEAEGNRWWLREWIRVEYE